MLTDKFMPPKDVDDQMRAEKRREMEQYADYRNYLSFSMFEQVTDEAGNVIRENFVDDMAGRDSGGEGQNPKYVALLAGFAMLYMQQSKRVRNQTGIARRGFPRWIRSERGLA